MVIILLLDVAQLFVGNHLAHEVNRRIVLAFIMDFGFLHHHFSQHDVVAEHLDGAVDFIPASLHRHRHGLVAQIGDFEFVVIIQNGQHKVSVHVS